MIMSEKNLTPFDGVNMKEIEEGLTIADGERLGHFDITANGDYAASTQGMAGFSDVNVNVPNTYTTQDEGKVVNSGALVAQTAMATEITENGEVDTTLYNSVTVNVPTEDSYVYLVYGTFSGGGPMGPGTLNMSAGYLGVLKVDDGNAVVDCAPRNPSGSEIAIEHIIINGTVNTINITRYSYPVSVSFKAGANISEFTVRETTVVPTGTEITAGNWYNALIQRVNGAETVTVEMNNSLERTVVTPQQ